MIKSRIKLDYLKVPSACNMDFELLEVLAEKFKKKIHISLGMTKKSEIDMIFNFFKKNNRNKDLVFYACTSDYPAKFDNLCLLEIKNLKEKFGNKLFDVAFSRSHLGIAVHISSYTLVANYTKRILQLEQT